MVRGRPRKPTQRHKIEGTYRKDRHGKRREPTLTKCDPPAAPEWLDAEGRALWNRLAPALFRSRIACAEDQTSLSAVCFWWSEFRRNQLRLRRAKKTETKQQASLECRRAWRECAGGLAKFGLTPADRATLKLTPDGNTHKDQEAALLSPP